MRSYLCHEKRFLAFSYTKCPAEKSTYIRPAGVNSVGRYYTARTQRVDMLHESAEKAETRSRRIEWGCSSLKDGKRRPCCCHGCAHPLIPRWSNWILGPTGVGQLPVCPSFGRNPETASESKLTVADLIVITLQTRFVANSRC